ncbi:general transcription factor IIH subunit 3-like [Oppia nitens]|uniref:general transcription factor IIH subunit 3-like n=1 Tax=Oppia nitens TaxID=1686743 RepID=UPI0023DA7793|nr:general transcription factor IIH subunit 3-like [Oppia nitens]
MNTSGTHLVLIIDFSGNSRLLTDSSIYYQWLDSVISFCNSHLLMSSLNNLTVIGSNSFENKVLYPMNEINGQVVDTRKMSNEGQYEVFHRVVQTVKFNVKTMTETVRDLSQSGAHSISSSPLMSGAIAMALCHINRFKDDYKCSRIVIMSSTSDESNSYASQYMNFMNCFFAAQKMSVTIDACIAGDDSYSQTTSLLQQGCDLTDGTYLKVPNIASFLEYLLWCLLPDAETRTKLVLPVRQKVSHSAACFCHRNIIDTGFVCSVCLSIFCTFSPICSTCHTIFKLGPIPQQFNKSKKKLKVK